MNGPDSIIRAVNHRSDGGVQPSDLSHGSGPGFPAQDELLWAAAWLYHATHNRCYMDYLANNGGSLGGTGWAVTEFGWDVKYAGVQVLAAKVFSLLLLMFSDKYMYHSIIAHTVCVWQFLLQGKEAQHAPVLGKYQQKAEYFLCSCLGKGAHNVRRTTGGLLFRQRWNNMQFVTNAAFLLTIYSDYITSAGRNVACAAGTASPAELLLFAKSQVICTCCSKADLLKNQR